MIWSFILRDRFPPTIFHYTVFLPLLKTFFFHDLQPTKLKTGDCLNICFAPYLFLGREVIINHCRHNNWKKFGRRESNNEGGTVLLVGWISRCGGLVKIEKVLLELSPPPPLWQCSLVIQGLRRPTRLLYFTFDNCTNS